jgi:hypothetical protein
LHLDALPFPFLSPSPISSDHPPSIPPPSILLSCNPASLSPPSPSPKNSDDPPSSEDDSTSPLFPSDPDREPSVVDTIFSHSETRILEALGAVQSEINAFALYKMECDRALAGGKEKELGEGVILSALSGLSTRIGNLEAERKHLRLTIDGLRGELEALGTNMDAFEVRLFLSFPPPFSSVPSPRLSALFCLSLSLSSLDSTQR